MIRSTVAFFVLILLAACGGGGAPGGGAPPPSSGSVSGRVVDRHSTPIEEMHVQLHPGGQSVITNSSGRFKIDNVSPETYFLTGSGGQSTHYVAAYGPITLASRQDVVLEDDIEAYEVIGIYIVSTPPPTDDQNESSTSALSLDHPASNRMKVITEAMWHRNPEISRYGVNNGIAPSIQTGNLGPMAGGDPTEVGWFYLKWEKPEPSYVETWIDFLGTDPSGYVSETVWHSDDIAENDPDFDWEEPKAFLDIDDEMVGLTLEPSQMHYFRIRTADKTYPPIGIPFVANMTGFAQNLQLNDGTRRTLSWHPPDGDVGGYHVGIIKDDASEDLVWDSDDMLLGFPNTTEIEVPESKLISNEPYLWFVDVYFYKDNGWLGEISRTWGHFVWTQ